MPYVTNPMTLAYGNRHYGAGAAGGFAGPGYNGDGDFTGGISQLANAALNGGKGKVGAQAQQDYYAAMAAKQRGEADAQARQNAATGKISDIFAHASDASQHVNDPVVTDIGPSNSGPVAQQYLAQAPGMIAAQAPFLTAADSDAAQRNYRFMVANQGAAGGTPDYGTTALTRAVVGAGGNESDVKGAIVADQPADTQAAIVGPTDSQVKGGILQNLSPSDQRLGALGTAGEGSLSPVQVTIPGPDGKPMTAVGAFDRRTGGISIPTQPQNGVPSPLAQAVTGPVAAPDGSVIGATGPAAPGSIPSAAPQPAPGTPAAATTPPVAGPQPFGAPPKGAASASKMTPEAIDQAAERYNITHELPPLGMGGSGDRQAILNRAAERQNASGGSVNASITTQSSLKADQAALTQLGKTRAQVSQFEGTAVKEAQLALSLAGKGLAGGGIPVINRWIQAGRTDVTGDPDVTSFNSALVSFKNEYARIMSTSGGTGAMTTDTARAEADELINKKMTGNQLEQTIATMSKSMKNRIDSINDEYATTQQRINSAGQPIPQAAPGPTTPSAAPGGGGGWGAVRVQ